MISFRITGQTEIAKALQGLASKVQKEIALETMQAAVQPMVVEARALSHGSIRSGALYRSIGFAIRQYKSGVTLGVIGPRHGFRTTLPDGTTADPTKYAHLVEYGHAVKGDASAWVKERPFMRPAFDSTSPQMIKIISKLLGQKIEDAAAKLAAKNARSAARARSQAVALGAPVI